MSETQSTGGRVRLARSMVGLTRKDLENRFNVSVNTLQAWESNKNLLSVKGAKKLNEAFIKSGLLCSESWLLTGDGQSPNLLEASVALPKEVDENTRILRELEAFKAINPSPIVIIIIDDGMEPIYSIGDFVAGNKLFSQAMDSLIGCNCIIETLQGDTLARKLLKGSKAGLYSLACINIGTTEQPIVQDIKPRYAAKIVLHRSKE
jgi:transcriptional regulator with XRE-family HTH domain